MNLPVSASGLSGRTGAPSAAYVDVSWGQAHLLRHGWPVEEADAPTLYALHGTAYSGRTFAPLMAEQPHRRIVALDTPGYGGSTRPEEPWTIPRYGEALAETIIASGGRGVDLLGYHTGALIALWIAAEHPDLVKRLVLIGVPFFPDAKERQAWRERLAHPMRLTEELDQFEERWAYLVAGRAPGASLERGFGHFVDELRAWPYGFWAHEAAFTFDPSSCAARALQPALILNPATPLAGPTREAAAAMPDARLIELPDLGHGVLDVAAGDLAGHIGRFLG